MHKCLSFTRNQQISQRKGRTAALLAWLCIASWTIYRTLNNLAFIKVLYFSLVYDIERTLALFIIQEEVYDIKRIL
jgi:hypothetical protein